ncbi:MAG: hypothetical protein MPW15_22535 [Candidatus Manganitrophus sp.]|nr:hypothetical protein [Candidatus Manganitrophus sp.]
MIWVFLKSDDTRLAEELIQIVEQARDADFTPQQVSLGVAGSSPVVVALNEEMIRGKGFEHHSNRGDYIFNDRFGSAIPFGRLLCGYSTRPLGIN